ncbi:hypothetical protein [Lapillicoccus sp.]|uniref:hypothetical protein n=1 Tax=Lapillicoccus sp. TaxID=1909287 RepID=UPI0039838261
MSAPEVERPALALVAFRVYAASLGWGMLAGAVSGSLYLALSVALHGGLTGSDGVGLLFGAAYGAPIGFLAGAVLGIGAVLGTLFGARSGSLRRAAWSARFGYLVAAALVLIGWRFGVGSGSDRWSEWSLVTVIALALAFGAWRSGRATRRAMVSPPSPRTAPPPRRA